MIEDDLSEINLEDCFKVFSTNYNKYNNAFSKQSEEYLFRGIAHSYQNYFIKICAKLYFNKISINSQECNMIYALDIDNAISTLDLPTLEILVSIIENFKDQFDDHFYFISVEKLVNYLLTNSTNVPGYFRITFISERLIDLVKNSSNTSIKLFEILLNIPYSEDWHNQSYSLYTKILNLMPICDESLQILKKALNIEDEWLREKIQDHIRDNFGLEYIPTSETNF